MKLIKRPLFWMAVAVLLVLVLVSVRMMGRSKAQQPVSTTAPVLEFFSNELVTVEKRDLKQIIQANGSLRAINQTSVKAKVAGEVKEVLVREGDSVKAGQLLARIEPIEYDLRVKQARQNMLSAQGQLDIAKRTLNNNQALLQQGFISTTALENAQGQFNSAQANVAANQAALALAQKSLSDTQVRAPMNGIVAARNVEPGEKVSVDGMLFDIVDLSALELGASVPAADIAQVLTGQEVAIKPEGFDMPLTGRITRISPANEAGSRSYLVYAKIEQAEARLRSGLFAQATITVAQKPQVLAVPQAAVRSIQDGNHIYAIEAGRLVQKKVTAGFASSDGWIEVESGVAAGTQVVRVNLGQLNEAAVKIKTATVQK